MSTAGAASRAGAGCGQPARHRRSRLHRQHYGADPGPVRQRRLGPNPAEVDRTEAALKGGSKTYEFHRYDGASHTFLVWNRTSYRQQQSNDAWEHTWNWFAKYLAPVAVGAR